MPPNQTADPATFNALKDKFFKSKEDETKVFQVFAILPKFDFGKGGKLKGVRPALRLVRASGRGTHVTAAEDFLDRYEETEKPATD